MKSQDVLVLLKLVSLHRMLAVQSTSGYAPAQPEPREEWRVRDGERSADGARAASAEQFTTRGLEASLGLSKSEISKAINRSIEVGLAIKDRKTGYPKTNTAALLDFIIHGLKYVFPARPGPMVRGMPTAFAAPVLEGRLAGAGSYIHVWPDASGTALGQRIEPLYKSVPHAVRQDPELYAMLALVDAIRLGNPREVAMARKLLESLLTIP